MARRSTFAPSLKQVMRQYSAEYLMRHYSPERLKRGRTSTEDYDKQFEREQREHVQEVRKALGISKKLYKKAKEITKRYPMPSLPEAGEALGAGDRIINVAGQTVGVSGLSPIREDATGFLAECEEAILEQIGDIVKGAGLGKLFGGGED